MILMRYIHQELTVDHSVRDLDRLYLAVREFQNRAPALSGVKDPNNDPNHVNIIDETVESHTNFIILSNSEITVDGVRKKVDAIAADTSFVELLSYSAKVGSAVFRSPTDAVITGRLAERLFGKEDPLGRTFRFDSSDKMLTVVGVLRETETRRTINFDLLLSMDLNVQWNRVDNSLIKLRPGVDYREQNGKYNAFVSLRLMHGGLLSRLQLFPLGKLYMDETIPVFGYGKGVIQKGNLRNVWLLTGVLVLLLVVGFFNYTNIYTVLMLNRAREFGVKKVYGAGWWNVFGQIWMENLLLTGLALLFVWSVIELTGGWMEALFSIPLWSDWGFDVGISLFVMFVFPVLVSIYPAVKYSYAAPVVSLRSVNVGGKSVVSRVLFLSMQYVITFFIVMVSSFFMKQLFFMLNMDLGYPTENIVRVSLMSHGKWMRSRESREKAKVPEAMFGRKMDESPLIERWSRGGFLHRLTPYLSVKSERSEYQPVVFISMTRDYMDMFGFELCEGRLWDPEQDEWAQYKTIINETAKRVFDIRDITRDRLQPEERLWYDSYMEGMDQNPPYEVVGVIRDFKTNHLSKANMPVMMVYDEYISPDDPFVIAVNPGQKAEAMAYLKEVYMELMGEGDIEYAWLEDEIAAMYREDKQVVIIYMTFAVMAILISCLGLYGLSLFDIRQRYREIALRKVNGALAGDIFALLRRKYMRVLVVSFLLSAPLSYLVIRKYLEGFAHKAAVSGWLFVVAALVVAAISGLTLYVQIRKAVRINPAEALKGLE
jgi:ABC-type antimicrobial peptide transport system permease subunit